MKLMDKKYFVYIVTNYTNTVLYIGVTNNLERRIYEHKNRLSESSFTNKYHLYKLIWFEEFNTPDEAILIEKRIKGWKREKKIDLINEKNPNFNDLSMLIG